MENSVVEMYKALTHYMGSSKNQNCTETTSKSSLEFDYIWRNLDHLFHQMTQDQVNELNCKFMNMAFEKVKENSKPDQHKS